jgi:hypothetical protein
MAQVPDAYGVRRDTISRTSQDNPAVFGLTHEALDSNKDRCNQKILLIAQKSTSSFVFSDCTVNTKLENTSPSKSIISSFADARKTFYAVVILDKHFML